MVVERETKQIIVMRKDLNMRKGKMVAQGAHASLGVFTELFSWDFDNKRTFCTTYIENPAIISWLRSSFKKVCVSVNSEKELLEIFNKVPKDIPRKLITDSGATEFNGVPTKTCCAVGPWWSDEIDEITGDLPLL